MDSVISKSTFLGKEIDVYGTAENPLFKAKDVAEWIEHSDVSTMMRSVDEDEKVTNNVCTLGGVQSMWFLTEGGLYEVLMQSRKPIAKQFKKGVKNILKSIRKTGSYFSNHQTVMDRLQTNITYADWVMKSLNLNQASKILWAKKLGDSFGLMTDAIPQYVNAGTENPTLHAATDLLKKHDVGITAQVFNKQLEARGIVTTATRPGKGGKTHSWKVLRQEYDRFGQNVQDPKFQSQTQIKWYDNTFAELLGIAGVNRERVLTEES